METFLFDKVIFGPVKSRRLGVSLGINLLPNDSKLCNFNCIYCECGWTEKKGSFAKSFHSREEVNKNLDMALFQLKCKNISLDAITFAGNGEPTMHPHFAEIVDDTIQARNKYFPNTKVAVLTNAAMLSKTQTVNALKKVELRILKLDAGTEELFQAINQPNSKRTLNWIVEHLRYFEHDFIIQSMFLKGSHDGIFIDNTADENVGNWLKILKAIRPKKVMLYSIDRATAEGGLQKASEEVLQGIAAKVRALGIETMVS